MPKLPVDYPVNSANLTSNARVSNAARTKCATVKTNKINVPRTQTALLVCSVVPRQLPVKHSKVKMKNVHLTSNA